MSRHLVRHAEVRWPGPDGELVYARRGEVVDVPDTAVPRLVDLGAIAPVDTDLTAPADDRPWSDVLQDAANARYDWAPAEAAQR